LTKPVPKAYSKRFFQLVTTRQFAEAERILERIKQKMHVSDRNRGYFQALYGMLLTMKNTDRYAFLSTVDLTDKKQVKHYRKEFLSHIEQRSHDEYDRGYFEAWSDFMKILLRIEAPPPVANNKTQPEEAKEIKTEEEISPATAPQPEIQPKEESVPEKTENNEKAPQPGQSLLVDYAKQD
jgi:hypothetical protein